MNGGQLVALVVCLAVMVAANVWVHVGPARWQPVTGPVAAALLLLVGRAAGPVVGAAGPRVGVGGAGPGVGWRRRGGRAAGVCRRPRTYRRRGGCSATPGTGSGRGRRSSPGRRWSCRWGRSSSRRSRSGACCGGCSTSAHGALWATGVVGGAVRALARPARRRRGPENSPTGRVPRADLAAPGGRDGGVHGAGRCRVRRAARPERQPARPGRCCTGRPTGWASSPPRWPGGGRRGASPRRVSRTRGSGHGSRARPAHSTRSVLLEHLPPRLFALPDGLGTRASCSADAGRP